MLKKNKILSWLFPVALERLAAEKLYTGIVEQSRRPEFYLAGGVADTVDGRFDLVVLNAILVFRRIKGHGPKAQKVSQALFDTMFENMDEALREIGIGDLSVGGKVSQMAEAFYGRAAAYEDAIKAIERRDLMEALRRNLYRDAPRVDAGPAMLADYVTRQVRSLDAQDIDQILDGNITFEALEEKADA